MNEQLDAWIAAHSEEILTQTRIVLQIPSIKDLSSAGPGDPFGRAVGDSLRHTLSLCGRLGLKTENFDGYAGHAEFGDGEEIVGMLGHLDVVPAGDGWSHDPWGAEVSMDRIWGRGTSDDKGPTYAALFGAIAVRDVCAAAGVALSRRVRLIFGCDEESGWECMAHYFGAAGQAKPTVAFTPDAYFPLVYAEKGSFTAVVSKRIEISPSAELRIQSLQAGLRANMVPGDAVATLVGEAAILDEVAHVLAEAPGVCVARVAGILSVSAAGRAAHGSTPEQGSNAAIKLLEALMAPMTVLDALDPEDREWMADLIGRGATDGSGLGIAGRDEVTGPLTSNLGVVSYVDGLLEATFNIRYPATWNGEVTIDRFRASLAQTGWSVPDVRPTLPLYVPQDQEPVRTLLRVYRERTGDTVTQPLTIGGRTYATTVAPVGVAYGAAMPGDPDVAHQADEYLLVERLLQCAGIYAQAIYELAR